MIFLPSCEVAFADWLYIPSPILEMRHLCLFFLGFSLEQGIYAQLLFNVAING